MAELRWDPWFLETTTLLLPLVEEGDITDHVTDQGPSLLPFLTSPYWKGGNTKRQAWRHGA